MYNISETNSDSTTHDVPQAIKRYTSFTSSAYFSMRAIASSYGFKGALQLFKMAFQPFQGAQTIWEKAKSPRYPCLLSALHF